MQFNHTPVLLDEVLEMLKPHPGEIMVDGTLGGAGHAIEIIKSVIPGGRLIGIDRDTNALEAAEKRLKDFEGNFVLLHDNFVHIKDILSRLDISGIDGMLLDLGVSSHQLDTADRGFTYKVDVPLDMRMDPTQSFSAWNVVNEYSVKELTRVIREYGEERWASRIAKFIVDSRPVDTTGELVDIIKAAIPASARRTGGHPAKRTFQAIRIEVNDELGILKQAITDAVDVLNPGGRLCIITFHSLEDRLVKQTFRMLKNPCTCSPQAPICTCGKKPVVNLINKKPITSTQEELNLNPRSHSAKLRGCQKLHKI